MDFYKKIKQKIEEELNQDDDDEEETCEDPHSDYGEGSGESATAEIKMLRKEVATLKQHINRNYDVYVKRLDKRKAKIKELEDNTKLILRENEALVAKLQETEGYGQQLTECRESLEQLDGFQSQELAKVKHMLLSAETSLQLEKEERLKLRAKLEELQKEHGNGETLVSSTNKSDVWTTTSNDALDCDENAINLDTESTAQLSEIQQLREQHESVVNDLKHTISVLESRLQASEVTPVKEESSHENQDQLLQCYQSKTEDENQALITENVDLKATLEHTKSKFEKTETDLQQQNIDLKEKLKLMRNERDAAKSAILEEEIAKHEYREKLTRKDSETKMELAQLTTEKETLEVTLELREKELKTRKEEFREEQERLGLEIHDIQELANGRALQNSALQAEIDGIKVKLQEATQNLGSVEATNQTNLIELDRLNKEIADKNSSVYNLQESLTSVNAKYDELNNDFETLVTVNDTLVKDNSDLKSNISTLSEKCEQNEKFSHEMSLKCDTLDKEIARLQNVILESENNFPERLENSDRVILLKQRNLELVDEVAEKKQSIKLLQQRLNDMKKTFQKELKTASGRNHYQQNGDDDDSVFVSSSQGRKTSVEFIGPTPSTTAVSSSSKSFYSTMSASTNDIHDTLSSIVDLTYLKHVIFKFLTSREYEAIQLTRAVATLLRFTPDEEQLLKEHLEWKTSWFGTKPNLGTGQFSHSIEPSS